MVRGLGLYMYAGSKKLRGFWCSHTHSPTFWSIKMCNFIFLHLSVSHSVHRWGGGVCLSACWDKHPMGRYTPGRYTPGQVHRPGQVHPPGRYTPPPTVTAVDGMHPTGMLSCTEKCLLHVIYNIIIFAFSCIFIFIHNIYHPQTKSGAR